MYNILSVYLWVLIISPLSAISAMMITILSHVISVGLQTRPCRLEANQQARTWKAGTVVIWLLPGPAAPPPLWFASPLAVSHPRPCRISFPCFRAQPTSHSDSFSPPKGCLFNTTSYPWYLCFLQDPIRMLWGLRFFPKESFPESKYYEGGQIISNYNLQKTGGLSQWRELGKENYRNICMKSNILFLSDQIM